MAPITSTVGRRHRVRGGGWPQRPRCADYFELVYDTGLMLSEDIYELVAQAERL